MASEETIDENEKDLCKICNYGTVRYCCPRCNILYCSLDCYQSRTHLPCSEYFYKNNVLEEISLNESEGSKTKMLQALQNVHENDSFNPSIEDYENIEDLENSDLDSDDDSNVDISERLAGVNLDDADQVWDRLTKDEKQEFEAFLRSEDVTKLIPLWKPWWLFYKEIMDEDEINSEGFKKNYPKVCDIKDFSQITTKLPSECVKYNLINILSAYVFTARYFNGEHFESAREAVGCLVTLSLTLKASENFNDFETAVKSVEQECINSDWITADKTNLTTMKSDLHKVLNGPTKCEKKFYVLCALSDIRNMLTELLKSSQNQETSNKQKKFPKEHFCSAEIKNPADVKKYRRKIDYYLSFTKYHYNPV